jgi:hypothetical protein
MHLTFKPGNRMRRVEIPNTTRAWFVNPTSVSLLDRLKAAGPDASDWSRLHEVYLPHNCPAISRTGSTG